MRKLYQIAFFLILSIQVYSQCCIRFDGKNCIQCPKGTHVFRGNCIFDIKDCATYKDGFDCATCNPGFQLNATGDCEVKPAPAATSPILPGTVAKDYTDTIVDPQNLSGPNGDTYMLSDQYLRTMNQNLASASVAGARVRNYVNGTSQTTIQYQTSPGTYYRGVLQMDVQTFLMKPISFQKISTLTLNQPTETPSPIPTVLKTEAVNLGNPAHIDKVSLIDASARAQNARITMIKSGNITSYSDGTYSLSLVYSTSTPGEEVLISGNILQSNTAKINDIKVLAATVNVSPNTDALDGTVRNPATVTQTATYEPINPLDTSDQNYLICKDFLVSQMTQCAGIDPTKVQRMVQGSKSSYIMTYTKPDGSLWDISMNINTDTFIAQIDKQTQITPPTKTPPSTYVKIDNNLIFKDINFLIVDDYINKQSKDKYKNSVIRSVERMESGAVTTYRVLFEQSGFVWEVVASINTNTFVTSGYKETKKQALSPAPASTTPNTNTSTSTNSTSSTQPLTLTQPSSTANTTQSSSSNATQTPAKNSTNSSGTTSNTSSASSTVAPKNSSNASSLNISIINTTNSSTSAVSSSTTPLSMDTRSSTTNTSTAQTNHTTTTTTTNSITPTPSSTNTNTNTNPNTNTNINTIANTNSNTNSNANTNANTNTNSNKPAVPPPFLASLASGLAALSNDDMSSGQFKQIDTLIRAVNPSELRNSVVIGAFIRTASFTRNYQIYYQSPTEIYEAVISRDQLRRRTYIISFGKIGF